MMTGKRSTAFAALLEKQLPSLDLGQVRDERRSRRAFVAREALHPLEQVVIGEPSQRFEVHRRILSMLQGIRRFFDVDAARRTS